MARRKATNPGKTAPPKKTAAPPPQQQVAESSDSDDSPASFTSANSLPPAPPVRPAPRQRMLASLREMIKLQNSTNRLIPLAPFVRVIREILYHYMPDARITPVALEGLQEAAEIYLTQLFEDSYRCTLHRDRVTLNAKDIQLIRILRGHKL